MKKLMAVAMSLIMAASVSFAESGTCGDNLTWNLTNGVLTISGSGDMKDYDNSKNWSKTPWYNQCETITLITIDNGVTSIGDHAFDGCNSLTSITIPRSLTIIGDWAFKNCCSLRSIDIPNSVTSIDSYAFYKCTSLTSIDIPSSVTKISSGIVYGCSSLTSVSIPNSIIVIFNNAFHDCTGLTSLAIPNSVLRIYNHAFSGCTGLNSIEIPNSVTSIEAYAFENCTNLTSVTIGNSVTSLGMQVDGGFDSAFEGCTKITSVTLNANAIASQKYSHAVNLKSIFGDQVRDLTIGDDVKYIGEFALENCTNLTSLTIGNGVKEIRSRAFYACSSLTSVSIPNSVTSLGERAFSGCSKMTSVTIGNSVTSTIIAAFDNTPITEIHFTGDIDEWCIKAWNPSGISYSYDLYIDGKRLTDLIIPNSVVSIGYQAFLGCTGLTSVTIPNSVTSIGEWAFFGCTGLTSIEIPNSVTSIGEKAFYDCVGLKSVTIGNSVTSIGEEAFCDCFGLKSVTCYATTPPKLGSLGTRVWDTEVRSRIPLYVPSKGVNDYKNALEWSTFKEVRPIAEDIDTKELVVSPSENSVEVAWPRVEGAETYEILIYDTNGKDVCTLVFDAEGRLLSIAYKVPSRGDAPQKEQTAGFSFTITGLETGTEYDLTIIAKNADGLELNKQNISFHTDVPASIEDIHIDSDKPVKVLHEGQVYILNGEKSYTITGQEL